MLLDAWKLVGSNKAMFLRRNKLIIKEKTMRPNGKDEEQVSSWGIEHTTGELPRFTKTVIVRFYKCIQHVRLYLRSQRNLWHRHGICWLGTVRLRHVWLSHWKLNSLFVLHLSLPHLFFFFFLSNSSNHCHDNPSLATAVSIATTLDHLARAVAMATDVWFVLVFLFHCVIINQYKINNTEQWTWTWGYR